MKKLLLPFCLLLTNFIHAQLPQMIKDSKNAWVVSFTSDIRLDMLSDEQVKKVIDDSGLSIEGGLDVLKLVENPHFQMNEGYQTLIYSLLNAANNHQIPIYSDKMCTQPFAPERLTQIDTLLLVDPTTYEQKIRVVVNTINPDDILLFRIYQSLAYQPSTGTWVSQVFALAPLKTRYTEDGHFVRYEPLFWIKVNNNKPKLDSKSITYAVRSRPRLKTGYLTFEEAEIHKRTTKEMPLQHFLDKANSDAKLPLYSVESWREKTLLSMKQRREMIFSSDTTIMIDPNTYESKEKVVLNQIKTEDIKKLRLVQEWFWDDRKKVLSVRLVGVAPMVDVRNEADEFLYSKPLFYRRFD